MRLRGTVKRKKKLEKKQSMGNKATDRARD